MCVLFLFFYVNKVEKNIVAINEDVNTDEDAGEQWVRMTLLLTSKATRTGIYICRL